MNFINKQRTPQSKVRQGPKRMLREMEDEFGVPARILAILLRSHNGPKPAAVPTNKHAGEVSYYDLKELRTWWATVPDEVKQRNQTKNKT